MKKNTITGTLLIAIVLVASSCSKKFEEYAVNPNQPVSVPAYLLLRQVENDIEEFPAGDADKF